MRPQIVCPRGCIVTSVAFVQLFSAVYFQMYPQIACLRGCIVTLIAFVRFFLAVSFQMCPQIACLETQTQVVSFLDDYQHITQMD